jgi:hypothetical protein
VWAHRGVVRRFYITELEITSGGIKRMGLERQSTERNLKITSNASLAWVKNNHTYKFGAEMRLEWFPMANFLSSYMAGIPSPARKPGSPQLRDRTCRVDPWDSPTPISCWDASITEESDTRALAGWGNRHWLCSLKTVGKQRGFLV